VTADATLVLGWLILAHLAADFLLQTESMVADKFLGGRRGWNGLLLHGAAVALCLVPVVAAFELRGLGLLVTVTLGHVVIDRWKVRATRRAEGRALAAAHRRHEKATTAGLGPAWTPLPGALFILDQLLHVALICGAWVVFISAVPPVAQFVEVVDRLLGSADRTTVHRVALVGVVLLSLAIVNVRAAALFVGTLVRPREAISGDERGDEPVAAAATPRSWRLRFGTLEATAEPILPEPPADGGEPVPSGRASPSQIGATIGVLERLLIVTFVLTGSTAAVGFVVGAKTLARFRQLDDRDFAEYYLLGTLASVAVALGSGLLAAAALATVR
jgi:uncharacterized protein DUF3307